MARQLHNQAAERSVLGGILLENAALDEVLAVSLAPEDFYADAHRTMFAAMLALAKSKRPIDTVELRDLLDSRGELARVGGDEALLGLTNTIPLVANIVAHAKTVRALSAQRSAVDAARRVIAEAEEGVESVTDFLDRAGKSMLAACEMRTGEGGFKHIGDIVVGVLEEMQARAESGGTLVGYSTGLADLDRLISGLCRGDSIVIAGRPGMGKSALMQQMMRAVAARAKLPALGFSLEMPRAQWGQRMLASDSGVDGQKVRGAERIRDHAEWNKLTAAANELSALPIWIDDTPGLSIHEIRRLARRQKSLCGGVGVIGIDYMQLCRAGGDSREQEIAEISRESKAMAKELDCPVLALSQLNRGVESRSDKRPMLSDLRESGAIEQDADTIIFVYRDEVYNAASGDVGTAELIVGKQRSGPTAMVRVAFDKHVTRFRDLDRHHEQRPPAASGYQRPGWGD